MSPGINPAQLLEPDTIARMNRRMQMMSGGRMMMRIEALDNNALNILTAYLEKNAQRTIELNKLGGVDALGGQAFQKTCSPCHARLIQTTYQR
jgi:hypothetical protein